MKKSTLLIAIGAVGVLVIFVCVACLIAGVISLPSDMAISEATGVVGADHPTLTPRTVIAQPSSETLEFLPVVTATSVPTNPPPPVDTPPPTSTPMPNIAALEILSHRSYENGGLFFIVGEVQNNSDQPMEFVEVVATLYGEDNNVTGTGMTYAELSVIPPGGKSPFQIITDKYAGTTHYELYVEAE